MVAVTQREPGVLSSHEKHRSHRIGWLRAAVLGANDGIVSTASLVIGVAAAGVARCEILLAGVAGLSRARFAAHFVAVVGQTPAAYLAAWRIALAQAALLRGRPVAVVAADVGYDSASALARAFGRIVGCSPRAWLRARREGGAS